MELKWKISDFRLHCLPDLQQIWTLFTSQGSAATYLRYVGNQYMAFVVNEVLFPAVKEFWKPVKIWQSQGQYVLGDYFFDSPGTWNKNDKNTDTVEWNLSNSGSL